MHKTNKKTFSYKMHKKNYASYSLPPFTIVQYLTLTNFLNGSFIEVAVDDDAHCVYQLDPQRPIMWFTNATIVPTALFRSPDGHTRSLPVAQDLVVVVVVPIVVGGLVLAGAAYLWQAVTQIRSGTRTSGMVSVCVSVDSTALWNTARTLSRSASTTTGTA